MIFNSQNPAGSLRKPSSLSWVSFSKKTVIFYNFQCQCFWLCAADVSIESSFTAGALGGYSKSFSAVQPRVSFLWLREQSVWIVSRRWWAFESIPLHAFACDIGAALEWVGARWDVPITRLPRDERIPPQLLRLIRCFTLQESRLAKVFFAFYNWARLVWWVFPLLFVCTCESAVFTRAVTLHVDLRKILIVYEMT